MPEFQKKKTPNPGQFREIFTWNEDRTELIVKDTEDLEEVMKERAKGVSIYEMLERYGDLELIPGYGSDTVNSDGNIHAGADLDLTNIPEFGTEILNAQLKQAEEKLAQEQEKAAAAQKAAEEAKAAAEAAAKAREEAISKLLAEKGENK